jgi:hypothetical protein
MHRDRLGVFYRRLAGRVRQGRGGHRDRPQDRRAVLQIHFITAGLCACPDGRRVARATSKGAYGALRLQIDLAEVDAQPIVRYSEVAWATHALHRFDFGIGLAHRSVFMAKIDRTLDLDLR